VVFQIQIIRVGDSFDQLFERVAHAEAEGNEQSVDKVFVDELNRGEI
jgi:hypothetical protein